MNKTQALKKLNNLIDQIIIQGNTKSAEYKRLCRLHYSIVKS